MYFQIKVKKWGSSLGLVIPKEIVNMLKIEKNQELQITVNKPKQLSSFYGALKGKKITWTESDRLDAR